MVQYAWEWKMVERKGNGPNGSPCKQDNVRSSPFVTSPPSLGATPTTRGSNNLIPARLFDTSQGISHLQPADTTQLCRCQLSPVSLQHNEPIFKLTHGGGQSAVAVYFGP